jgi:hypothetical protein
VAELRAEDRSPRGDPTRHRTFDELDAALRATPAAPRDAGRLALIVRRLPDGTRETPQLVTLSCDDGVPGDDWTRRPPRELDAQLAVIQRDVAALLANGQPLTLSGDNLLVDLDLSDENLPAGSRLRLGESLVVVTPKPHNGCNKFAARFGLDALRFVQAKPTRHRNLRGTYWRVLEPGIARVGDAIRVVSRG